MTNEEIEDNLTYLELARDTAYKGVQIAQLAELAYKTLKALQNERALGIHSCGDHCSHPLCVMRRERDRARKAYLELAKETAQVEATQPPAVPVVSEPPTFTRWKVSDIVRAIQLEQEGSAGINDSAEYVLSVCRNQPGSFFQIARECFLSLHDLAGLKEPEEYFMCYRDDIPDSAFIPLADKLVAEAIRLRVPKNA